MVFDRYDEDEPFLDPDEVQIIIELLREWAYGHPRQDEPLLIQMGGTWTPREFYVEVAERTSFGEDFLKFLFVQAQRSNEKPSDCIQRTVKANLS